MGRAGADHGAAVRDADGRSYAGAPVALSSLSLTALQVAVASAVSSGAQGFEAAVLIGEVDGADPGVAALREVTPQAHVLLVDAAGEVRR
ncbi:MULTISPECIES: cytidine deaminase [Tsukamurella]|uniref:Cytidine deaminase n=2 Tax=Tsukamurella strandjordii TaxID=147577 RepID=A0AA90NC14_9ACTN|nr:MULTISPECIES: cytidine deaminase [Tsukamurella]MDP0398965.1 cytidine deaminase [Tsukamurella strandjordii]